MKSFLLLLQLIFVSPSDAKNYEYRLIQSNNFQRQELLQQKCDKFHLDNDYVNKLSDGEMEHLLVDKEHKFLYCYVPKVSVSYLFSIQIVVRGQKTLPFRWGELGNLKFQY